VPPQDPLVVFFSHSARLAGGEIAMVRLAAALRRHRARVVLGEEGPVVALCSRSGVPVEVLPLPEGIRSLDRGVPLGDPGLRRVSSAAARYVAELTRLLRSHRPALLHANSLKAGLLGGPAARLTGLPMAWHVRDRIHPDYLPAVQVRLVRAAIRRLATVALANSHATRHTIPGRVPTTVVPSPVDPALLALPPPPGDREDLVFLALGRLSPWKGQHLFLDAFARAFPTGPERAVIAGGPLFGEERYATGLRHRATELGIAERVHWTGHLDDVTPVLAAADVVVHTSVIPEPFGLTVAEGMAAGRPVVAQAAGGPAEVITDGADGLLSPMGDPDALAERLQRLARDPGLRRRLSHEARRSALAFRPEAIAERVERTYDLVLAAPGRRVVHLAVNGRYRSRPVTGVERFARGVVPRLQAPTAIHTPPAPLARRGLGHLWEQLVLPLTLRRSALLWSPCNFGPALLRRQIVTVHDLAPLDHPEWFSRGYRRWAGLVLPHLCRRASHVTAVSGFTRDRLADAFGLDPSAIRLTPNGVDPYWAAPDPDDPPSWCPPAGFVLTVGSHEPRKNLARATEAFRRVRAGRDLDLVVVGGTTPGVFSGTGPIDDDSTGVGRVSDGELRTLYRRASCLAYVSLYEGFGLPPLEALAAGTRVVASDIPPHRETLAGVAELVDPTDVDAIAAALQGVLTETVAERAAAIEAGRRRAARFRWETPAAVLDELLDGFAGRSGTLARHDDDLGTPRGAEPGREVDGALGEAHRG
jgi:glycosyltransferase involved in cell wall biosynthesis